MERSSNVECIPLVVNAISTKPGTCCSPQKGRKRFMSETASRAIDGVDGPVEVPRGRPTIYDVANRAGVSKSLVSLVLRGSANVSPARRDAVLTAIRELGYRPSQAATVLASRRTQAIQVVIDDYRNLWFVDLLDGRLDTFLMSCRVIGRKVEDRLLDKATDLLRARGRERILGEFVPTRVFRGHGSHVEKAAVPGK